MRDPVSEEDGAAEDIRDFCIKCTQAQHIQKERQTYRTMVYVVAYMNTQYRNLVTGFTACQDKRET